MGKKVDYFVSKQIAPTIDACTMVDINARYVPALINGLTRYLSRSFWLTDEDYATGYQGVAREIERLLMPCSESIVRTLAMVMGYPPDVALDPVYGTPQLTGEGTNLSEFRYDFYDGSRAPGVTLRAIRDATERTATATEDGLFSDVEGEDIALLVQLLGII